MLARQIAHYEILKQLESGASRGRESKMEIPDKYTGNIQVSHLGSTYVMLPSGLS
jgi:hypothetical protein